MPTDSTDPYAALDKLRRVQSVTDAALANLIVEDLLNELLVRVSEALQSDTAAILLLDEDRAELVARAAKGIEEEVEQGVRIPLGKGFAGRIAAEGRPVILDEVDHSNVLNPILREKGIRSLLGVPLITQGRLIGVLHVGTLTPRLFGDEDVDLLRLVADRVALAIHVGLYERERLVTRTLQRTFLPESFPEVRGVQFSASYIPAPGSGVGGDWYDVFVLPDGMVALVVGDVVGKGLHAASVMGRLRNTVRAYAVAGFPPAEVVDSLQTSMEVLEPKEMATLLYAVLNPDSGELTIVNAGHPPPLLTSPSSEPTFLETQKRPPLGARVAGSASAQSVFLEPGATVLLYTDGLVELRTVPLEDRLELLRATAATVTDFSELTATLLAELVDDSLDDIALLAIHLPPAVAPVCRVTVPAHADQLGHIRAKIRRYLFELDLSPTLQDDVLVSIGEATANAVEHAYGAGQGQVDVELSLDGDELIASVRDLGRWRRTSEGGRGRGLPIMQNLASSMDIRRSESGTEVRLTWRIDGEGKWSR
jgi:anti-sigma regulatory factor (Ser/Thr protein kinase)/putative methionine-R-sulfoxide reductase with GAF domain